MKVKWLGHASFLITADDGTRIITDPYITGNGLSYGEIKESADIVTVSHDHFDHNNVTSVGGNPRVVNDPSSTDIKGIKFRGIPTYHDDNQGKDRGNNIIFIMGVDGVTVCHLGDLGHPLSSQQVADIGRVDVVLIPVGGFFTIDARVATEVCSKLNPGVVIPMHFKNDRCDFPIGDVEDFLRDKKAVIRADATEAEFKAGELPDSTEIVVLDPAL
jgi:L-ascorbate metabolism protein UlaG (beta-lactamase superfamily)